MKWVILLLTTCIVQSTTGTENPYECVLTDTSMELYASGQKLGTFTEMNGKLKVANMENVSTYTDISNKNSNFLDEIFEEDAEAGSSNCLAGNTLTECFCSEFNCDNVCSTVQADDDDSSWGNAFLIAILFCLMLCICFLRCTVCLLPASSGTYGSGR